LRKPALRICAAMWEEPSLSDFGSIGGSLPWAHAAEGWRVLCPHKSL
jgi:hypothetical protein